MRGGWRTGADGEPPPPRHGSVWQSLSLSLQELWTRLWVSEALAGLSQAKDRRAQSRDRRHSECPTVCPGRLSGGEGLGLESAAQRRENAVCCEGKAF